MIPIFTIVTTLVTIGVTALLIGILVRINNPNRQRRDGSDSAGAPLVVDNGGSNRRQDQDGSDGGGSDIDGDGASGD
jgi:hypothetical protein